MPSIETPWFKVPELKEKYGLVDYVETGCDKGVSLGWARHYGFESIITCDINADNAAWAKKSVPEAIISIEDSIDFLKRVLPTRFRLSLFWIDAHFPDDWGVKGTPEQQYPVYEELKLIRDLKPGYEKDVILCDDICHIHAVDNPRYRPGECDWKHPNRRPLKEYTDLFADTHDYQIFMQDTGGLLFTPKK